MIKISTAILTFALSMTIFSTTVQADQTVQAQKDWTFLVYINGHNNLDDFGAQNIKGMEKVGSSDKLNIVVQWASEGNQDTRRLLVQKDTTGSSTVTSPVVQSITPRVDMGDSKSLLDFITWGVQNYPAKHYFIAVWDHGNGWHLQDMNARGGNMHAQDISWDDLSGNHITTEQLGQVMTQAAAVIGHKVDIYGSDACLMAMAEVAGEMKDSVSVFVGSQETEPGAGWPYETFLADWAKNSAMTAPQIGATLSKDYMDAYNGGIYGNSDVTFSAFDMSHYDGLTAAVKSLSAELQNQSNLQGVQTAANNAQAFVDTDYKDLYDFVSGVEKAQTSVKAATLADVKKAVQNFVITTNNTDAYKNAHGLSIWLPSSYEYSQYADRYKGLTFDKITNWSGFVSKLQ